MKTKVKNYHIFRVEEVEDRYIPKKITMMKIFAKDDDDAYLQLKEYVKAANKEYQYYVEPYCPSYVFRNGKKIPCNDFIDQMKIEREMEPWYKKVYDKISIELWHWFVNKPKNAYYWLRDIIYLLKHKQEYCSSWCIDDKILDLLLFNIPILMKNKHCLSWKMLDKAILEKNPKYTKEDIENYHKRCCSGYGKDIEDRAVELEKVMFKNLINEIKTYRYYRDDFWYIDKKDNELVELDKKLRPTLPLVKGAYDRYDYKKLHSLVEKHWNKIWEIVRVYGQEFND